MENYLIVACITNIAIVIYLMGRVSNLKNKLELRTTALLALMDVNKRAMKAMVKKIDQITDQ